MLNMLNRRHFTAAAVLCGLIAGVFYGIIFQEKPYRTASASTAAEHLLIFDPGHGGEDGGAVAVTGAKESGINLEIALHAAALADFLGIRYRLTRDSEELAYPGDAETTAARKRWDTRRRVELANEEPCAFLLSIHQNNYPDGRPKGPQVFYNKTEEGKAFAELLQKNMTLFLCPDNRRVAAPAAGDIYIMAHADCPAVLAECGFLSNEREAVLLMSKGYQQKIALILMGTYLQFTEDCHEDQNNILLY